MKPGGDNSNGAWVRHWGGFMLGDVSFRYLSESTHLTRVALSNIEAQLYRSFRLRTNSRARDKARKRRRRRKRRKRRRRTWRTRREREREKEERSIPSAASFTMRLPSFSGPSLPVTHSTVQLCFSDSRAVLVVTQFNFSSHTRLNATFMSRCTHLNALNDLTETQGKSFAQFLFLLITFFSLFPSFTFEREKKKARERKSNLLYAGNIKFSNHSHQLVNAFPSFHIQLIFFLKLHCTCLPLVKNFCSNATHAFTVTRT